MAKAWKSGEKRANSANDDLDDRQRFGLRPLDQVVQIAPVLAANDGRCFSTNDEQIPSQNVGNDRGNEVTIISDDFPNSKRINVV